MSRGQHVDWARVFDALVVLAGSDADVESLLQTFILLFMLYTERLRCSYFEGFDAELCSRNEGFELSVGCYKV